MSERRQADMHFLRVVFFLCLACGSASAAELSLSDCLERAGRLSPQAVDGILREAQAREAKKEAEAGRLTHLSIVGAYQQSNNSDIQVINTNEAFLHLQQNLSPFSPQWALARQKEAEYQAAVMARTATAQDVDLQVKTLYLNVLKESDYLGRFNDMEKALAHLKETVIPKYSVGRTAPFDLVKIETALSDLTRSRELTRAQLETDEESLALIVGLSGGAELSLKPVAALPSLPEQATRFENNENSQLGFLGRAARAAQLAAQAAGYEKYPSLNGAIDYGYGGTDGFFNLSPHANFPANAYSSPVGLGWDFSLTFGLPIWNWGEISSRVAQRQKDADLAQNQLALQTQQLEAQLVNLRLLAESHLSDKKRMDELLPKTREAAEIQVKRYRLGASGILEASDALSLWLQTMINERDDYYSYLEDLAQLEKLMGKSFVQYQ